MAENQVERGGYIEAVGRRKHAVARVRVSKIFKKTTVNGKDIEAYFPKGYLTQVALRPRGEKEEFAGLHASITVKGGGISAQAQAVSHGLARALVACDEGARKLFKDLGLLTRDSRQKERKKFGLRKARRAPQWSKR
ncbi:MAG: 30S ribosomal protein S9 [Candidatus Kaiserbacteria bacterium]|nr:30S ribosomal protein S9 [Candidatus Kaiserbacteria bacterium]